MAKSNDIYQTLINYIQEDNNHKLEIQKQLSAMMSEIVETRKQAQATNGRVTKLEGDVILINDDVVLLKGKYDEQTTIRRINWKWLAGIGAVAMFFVDILVGIVMDWIKTKIN